MPDQPTPSPDELPYSHGEFHVSVNVSVGRGEDVEAWGSFGVVRVWAMEGRAVGIEIEDELRGFRVVAILDEYRPRRARVDLQTVAFRHAIEEASRVDGLPTPFPEIERPRGERDEEGDDA